jgi:hypothetical protein
MAPRVLCRFLFANLAVAVSLGGAILACGNDSAMGSHAGGCSVARPPGCPNWTKDVWPIIEARCNGCHGEGGIEQPKFDYTTYRGVFNARGEILFRVGQCTMPLADAAQPTPGERGTLLAWVECDAPND